MTELWTETGKVTVFFYVSLGICGHLLRVMWKKSNIVRLLEAREKMGSAYRGNGGSSNRWSDKIAHSLSIILTSCLYSG